MRRLCAPKGDEEGDGEVGHETVVDAQGRISLSDGLGNAGQGGVHARRDGAGMRRTASDARRAWSDDEILSAFQQNRLQQTYSYELCTDIEKKVAELLAEGNVVARFKGNEEFGQRSLGNRAILANPYADGVVQEINELIKNRDFWMPFASSILDEDFEKYVQADNKNTPLYMIMTYDTHPAAAEISGGIHPYDKTVRPQLVNNEDNPEYWRLIKEFKNITTIGAVLNTSLNLHGLPIVHTPEDAFHVMENSELKYLAIGNYLFSKEPR